GHAWLSQQIVIVDPDSQTPCRDGRVGEIWLSGPSVAQGYWQQPDETRQTFHAQLIGSPERSFLRTGDLGLIQEGELFITGRLKDVLIVRSQNHYPQDIVATVQKLEPRFRADAGAVFLTECHGIEHLVMVQEILRPGKDFDAAEVARRVRQ